MKANPALDEKEAAALSLTTGTQSRVTSATDLNKNLAPVLTAASQVTTAGSQEDASRFGAALFSVATQKMVDLTAMLARRSQSMFC